MACNFIKKETLALMFSCEFWEILKNTFFTDNLRWLLLKKPASNIYFEKLFENTTLDWSKIYLSPRLVTIDTTLRSFQYKILNNILFLNEKEYSFGITRTALRSSCNTLEETPIHIFFDCIHVKCIWERLQPKCLNDFILPSLTQQPQ